MGQCQEVERTVQPARQYLNWLPSAELIEILSRLADNVIKLPPLDCLHQVRHTMLFHVHRLQTNGWTLNKISMYLLNDQDTSYGGRWGSRDVARAVMEMGDKNFKMLCNLDQVGLSTESHAESLNYDVVEVW